MGAEKVAAANEAAVAVAVEMTRTAQAVGAAALRGWWDFALLPAKVAGATMRAANAGASRASAKALAPVHRRVTANAKRLRGR